MNDTDSHTGNDEASTTRNDLDGSEETADAPFDRNNQTREKDADEKAALYQQLNEEADDVDPDITAGSAESGGEAGNDADAEDVGGARNIGSPGGLTD